MKKAIWLILPLIMWVCGIASAEFYKYTDQNGTVHFTDDLNKIPPDQRPKATQYEAAEPTAPPAAPSKEMETQEADVEKDANTNEGASGQAEQIKRKQDELNREYQDLMEEKAHLEAEWNKAKTPLEKIQVNQKKSELNKRIVQYEQKRKTLNAEIETYNTRMNQDSKKNDQK